MCVCVCACVCVCVRVCSGKVVTLLFYGTYKKLAGRVIKVHNIKSGKAKYARIKDLRKILVK